MTENSSSKNISAALCGMYGAFGYTRYKMNKFEEYDLYARNKDFLVADSVIAFTDTNGKLMALKPDVTLSIAKNCRDTEGAVNKLYYDENVYRVSKGTNSFREIRQLGVECTGSVDDYCILEVLSLAAKSLAAISDVYALDISELSVLSELLDGCDITPAVRTSILKCVGEKNVHETAALCRSAGIDPQTTEILRRLILAYGAPGEIIPELKKLLPGSAGLKHLEKITAALGDRNVRVDFSVISDMNYYNGIVFKGFVGGIPDAVISGGQYDRLMKKMKHTSRAVGFAVYLDLIESFSGNDAEYDADVLIVYNDECEIAEVFSEAEKYASQGKTVCVHKNIPGKLRYRELVGLTGGRSNG